MKIQIFGSGCEKCTKLYETVERVIQQHELEAELEKVTRIEEITAAGVMMTPALGIDGSIVSAGKVLSEREVLHLLAPGHAHDCGCHGEVSGTKPKRFKQLFSAVLLAIVLASVGMMILRESRRPSVPAQTAVTQEGPTVYYFHSNHPCAICDRMEELTLKAVKGKGVTFKAVNLDDPANKHFVKEFELESNLVVIVHKGKYQKMDKVWDLVSGDEAAFITYIQSGLPKE